MNYYLLLPVDTVIRVVGQERGGILNSTSLANDDILALTKLYVFNNHCCIIM